MWLLLAGPAALASEPCSADAGVQLVPQRLLPGAPGYYLACGFPAASTLLRQVAVADDEAVASPSSCAAAVCVFSTNSGQKLRTHNLTQASEGQPLSAGLAPLIESLRHNDFRPMQAVQPIGRRGENSREQGSFRISFHRDSGTAFVVARINGYAATTHRFRPRTMRCPSHPTQQVLPDEVRAWALEGVAALAVAAEYRGQEPGCSWTQWVVVPVRQKTQR